MAGKRRDFFAQQQFAREGMQLANGFPFEKVGKRVAMFGRLCVYLRTKRWSRVVKRPLCNDPSSLCATHSHSKVDSGSFLIAFLLELSLALAPLPCAPRRKQLRDPTALCPCM